MCISRRFLFILCIFSINSQIFSQNTESEINANFKNLPLQHALGYLKQEYDIVFAYDHSLVDDVRINKSIENASIDEALDRILEGTTLGYQIISPKRVILIPSLEKSLAPTTLSSVRGITEIKGFVRDKESYIPLPYACIRVKGTNIGTISNKDGSFNISVPTNNTVALEISYVGYEKTELTVEGTHFSSSINAQLIPNNVRLNEVLIEDGSNQTIEISDGASSIHLNPQKIYLLSGLGEPDVTKAIQLLPGISIRESSSGLYVRGGSPAENQLLFDGITFYGVDHFFGFFSAFNSLAIKDVNVYRGGFGPKYGGFISSVINLSGKQGNTDSTHVNVRVNLLSASASVESPLFEGKGSFMLAARGALTDIFETSLYRNLLENTVDAAQQRYTENDIYSDARQFNPRLRFYDTNFKLSLQPSSRDHLSFSFLRSNDFLDYPVSDSATIDLPVRITSQENVLMKNTGLSLNWTHQWNNNLYSKTNIAHSEYNSQYELYVFRSEDSANFETDRVWTHKIKDRSFRTDFEWKVNDFHQFDFGIELSEKRIDRNFQVYNFIADFNESKGDYRAAYINYNIKPISNLTLSGGLRYQHFSPNQSNFYEPRLSLKYLLAGPLKMKAAWGIYHQVVNKISQPTFIGLGDEFWALSGTENTSIPRSDHLMLGMAMEFPMFVIDIEAYRKNLSGLNIHEMVPNQYEIRPTPSGDIINGGTGISQGIDVILQKKVGIYTSWLSYSLSEVIHQFDEINDGTAFFAAQDQRHQLKWVNTLSKGRWDFSATWVYATGRPSTDVIGPLKIYPSEAAPQYVIIPDEINNERLPAYHRLDLSAAYHLVFGKSGRGRVGVSIFNAYNRANIKYKRYSLIYPSSTNSTDNKVMIHPEVNADEYSSVANQTPTLKETNIFNLPFNPNVYFQVSF